MTNKIIEAARLAGFANQFPTDQMLGMFERFYAIVRAEALEDAAKVCDQYTDNRHSNLSDLCAEAIRALKEQQHG